WVGGGVAVFLVAQHLIGNSSAASTTAADTSGASTGTIGDIGTPGPADTTTQASPTGTTGTTSTTNSTGQTTQTSKTYVVQPGDTLNSIASKNHVDEPALYSLNASTIEATAHAHNMPSSDGG